MESVLKFTYSEEDESYVVLDIDTDTFIGVIEDFVGDWWYCQGRNGHYLTSQALREILEKVEELNKGE